MSMYLFDDTPIVVNTTLANEIGLNEAIVLQQINYWIEINKRAGKNYYDGKYWTYNSIKSWHEKNFKFLSVETVRRVFTKLEKSGFIITGNYNKDPRDKTKWYTINDKKLEELYFEVENRKKRLENEKLKENGFEAIPNAFSQNDQMEDVKMTKCIESNYINPFSQNDQMQLCEMNKPLPENTTEIKTENNNQSIYGEMIDGRDREDYLEELRINTDYYKVLEKNEFKAKKYDDILKLLADVLIQKTGEILINQLPMRMKYVRERFLSLNSLHMDYIVECLDKKMNKIKNIRSYILTTVFNAPFTISSYYNNQVNCDLNDDE